MPTATITIAYVNEPKEGRKTGSVKTRDGVYYDVWPDKLSLFQQNGVYEIEFTEKDSGGRTYRTITTANKKGEAPAQQRGGGARNSYRETSQTDAERMFVCSMVNAAIQAARVEFSAIAVAEAVNDMRQVWNGTFGQKADPSGREMVQALSSTVAGALIAGIRAVSVSADLLTWGDTPAFKALVTLCNEPDKETVRGEFGGRLKALKTAERVAA